VFSYSSEIAANARVGGLIRSARGSGESEQSCKLPIRPIPLCSEEIRCHERVVSDRALTLLRSLDRWSLVGRKRRGTALKESLRTTKARSHPQQRHRARRGAGEAFAYSAALALAQRSNSPRSATESVRAAASRESHRDGGSYLQGVQTSNRAWTRRTTSAARIAGSTHPSNSFPFHVRAARSISPSALILRPSETPATFATRHLFLPMLS